VPEWLWSGLQNRLPRFNSGRRLQQYQILTSGDEKRQRGASVKRQRFDREGQAAEVRWEAPVTLGMPRPRSRNEPVSSFETAAETPGQTKRAFHELGEA
jgi:hypothetical protein